MDLVGLVHLLDPVGPVDPVAPGRPSAPDRPWGPGFSADDDDVGMDKREVVLVALWSLNPAAALSFPAISWPSFASLQPSALLHRLSCLTFCLTSFFKSEVLGL